MVLRYRIHLEQRRYAPATINLRVAAVRRIAYEAADAGLLSPELAAGIRRVRGVRRIGVRLGNWLTPEQGRRLLAETDVATASLAAGELSAVYLRIDSNRATDASSGSCGRRRWIRNRAAAAADNLALGRTVIADCVNPWPLTRDAWQQVGQHVMFESPRLPRTATAVSRDSIRCVTPTSDPLPPRAVPG